MLQWSWRWICAVWSTIFWSGSLSHYTVRSTRCWKVDTSILFGGKWYVVSGRWYGKVEVKIATLSITRADYRSLLFPFRVHLGVDRWILFGGSWGSTLSLAYAEKHIDRVLAMVLRGIFTLRDEEIRFFYQSGTSYIFPDVWEKYVAPIPENERDDFVTAYYKRLTGNNEEERLRCAKAWSTWEMATSQLKVNKLRSDESLTHTLS